MTSASLLGSPFGAKRTLSVKIRLVAIRGINTHSPASDLGESTSKAVAVE